LEAGLVGMGLGVDCAVFRETLANEGVELLESAHAAPQLRRERTRGEWRAVDPKRASALERAGYLGRADAEHIRLNGAIAAHLEGVERNEGFAGLDVV
jgi:hypothetical protein